MRIGGRGFQENVHWTLFKIVLICRRPLSKQRERLQSQRFQRSRSALWHLKPRFRLTENDACPQCIRFITKRLICFEHKICLVQLVATFITRAKATLRYVTEIRQTITISRGT